MPKPDLLADVLRQLAFISALVGGFSFAFVGVLLVAPGESRVVTWTAGMSMASTAGLVVCALGWSISAPMLIINASMDTGAGKATLAATMNTMHIRLSQLFLVSFFLFLISLGLSGWIRSRVLGVVSTSIAVLATIAFVLVLLPFVTIK